MSVASSLFVLYLGAHVVTAAVTAGLGWWAIARTEMRSRRWFGLLMADLALWSALSAVSLLVAARSLQILLRLLWTVTGLTAVLLWILFVVEYTHRDLRQNRVGTAFALAYLVLAVAALVSPLYDLYYTSFTVSQTPFPHTVAVGGPLRTLGLAYVFLGIGTGAYYMGRRFAQTRYRSNAGIVVISAGVLLGAVPLVASEVGLAPVETYNHTPFGISVFVLAVWYAMFGLDVHEFVPIVRDEVVEQVDDPFFALDSDAQLLDYNPAARDLSPALGADSVGDPLEATFPEWPAWVVAPSAERTDILSLSVDGEKRYYSALVSAIAGGSFVEGYAVLLHDITDRKRYEQTIEDQNRKLELLNRIVRHDVRNNMATINARAELAEDHVDDEGRDHLDAIVRSSEEVVDLTDVLRDLMTTMLDDDEDVYGPVPLDGVLQDEIDAVRSREDTSVEVSRPLPDVAVCADDMLATVFRNILTNAVRHNDADRPRITVTATVGGEQTDRAENKTEEVTVRIADNGPGVPDAQKEEVFGRGEKGLESPGTGVGLYLVDTLVESYGGEVWLEDNEPEGAVFVVTLPTAG